MEKKKRKNSKKKLLLAVLLLIFLAVASYFIFFNKQEVTNISTNSRGFSSSGESQQVLVEPLSSEEKEKVTETIIGSDFIKDIPEDYPISIRFYKFENGQRVWQDSFLIGENEILIKGRASVYLTLHSKYISEINEGNLCEVIKKANQNGDLGFDSEMGKTELLWKYKGMLQHRECFGF